MNSDWAREVVNLVVYCNRNKGVKGRDKGLKAEIKGLKAEIKGLKAEIKVQR